MKNKQRLSLPTTPLELIACLMLSLQLGRADLNTEPELVFASVPVCGGGVESVVTTDNWLLTRVEGGFRIWDIQTGEVVSSIESDARAASFSPDGNHLVTFREIRFGDVSEMVRPVVWNTLTGESILALPEVAWFASYLDNNRILLSYEESVWIVDSTSGETIRHIAGLSIESAVLFPDGKRVLSHRMQEAGIETFVWDLELGEVLTDLFGAPWGDASHISEDEQTVMFFWASQDCSCDHGSVFDVKTGRLLHEFRLKDVTYGLQDRGDISPDGRFLVQLARGDTESRPVTGIWDLETFELVRRLDHNSHAPRFTSDGQRVITVGVDGLTKIWDIRDLVARPRLLPAEHGIEMHWDLGTLQFSPSVNGPWTDLPAASPFALSPIGDKGFFRVKVEE